MMWCVILDWHSNVKVKKCAQTSSNRRYEVNSEYPLRVFALWFISFALNSKS